MHALPCTSLKVASYAEIKGVEPTGHDVRGVRVVQRHRAVTMLDRILNRVQDGLNGQKCVLYLVTKWKYQAK